MSNLLEQLKAEQVVDVFQAVKALRLHHPDCVGSLVRELSKCGHFVDMSSLGTLQVPLQFGFGVFGFV